MSALKGEHEMDISRWHATNYATVVYWKPFNNPRWHIWWWATEICLFCAFPYNSRVDDFGTVVGENPTPYGILVLWAVNGLSIVCWECYYAS